MCGLKPKGISQVERLIVALENVEAAFEGSTFDARVRQLESTVTYLSGRVELLNHHVMQMINEGK